MKQSNYKKEELIAEGKTKEVWRAKMSPWVVIIKNKNDITAFDSPKFTREFASKAETATIVTSRVFEFLRRAGLPVAFMEQISATEFVAPKCAMIPLEAVARRFAVGSYIKRNPDFKAAEDETPHRFDTLVTEFFLKTTGGCLIDGCGHELVSGLDPAKGEEDPLIADPYSEDWDLLHPKKPHQEAFLGRQVRSCMVVDSKYIEKMDRILRQVFLVLEAAWAMLDCTFIDLKIEFGLSHNNNLLVADVIDNDSWRLRDKNWCELSKESFRQGEDLGAVEEKYGIVAALAQKFPTI